MFINFLLFLLFLVVFLLIFLQCSSRYGEVSRAVLLMLLLHTPLLFVHGIASVQPTVPAFYPFFLILTEVFATAGVVIVVLRMLKKVDDL